MQHVWHYPSRTQPMAQCSHAGLHAVRSDGSVRSELNLTINIISDQKRRFHVWFSMFDTVAYGLPAQHRRCSILS
jgi:hypothetical protein